MYLTEAAGDGFVKGPGGRLDGDHNNPLPEAEKRRRYQPVEWRAEVPSVGCTTRCQARAAVRRRTSIYWCSSTHTTSLGDVREPCLVESSAGLLWQRATAETRPTTGTVSDPN